MVFIKKMFFYVLPIIFRFEFVELTECLLLFLLLKILLRRLERRKALFLFVGKLILLLKLILVLLLMILKIFLWISFLEL